MELRQISPFDHRSHVGPDEPGLRIEGSAKTTKPKPLDLPLALSLMITV